MYVVCVYIYILYIHTYIIHECINNKSTYVLHVKLETVENQ